MKYIITSILCLGMMSVFAFKNPENVKPNRSNTAVNYRMNCAQSTRSLDLDINNVRARLQIGGDVWWDGNNGRYIVPKVEAGETEVSSIFAGAVWIGGVDPAGNLKIAAQTYGRSTGSSDFWPGPLTESGFIDADACAQWDRFFTVTGAEIDLHIAQFQAAEADPNLEYDNSLIPKGVREWPAKGNPFFAEIYGFELPDAEQGLGAFEDVGGGPDYNPEDGDYPKIEIRGCPEPQYPDQMHFWIYNDAGNAHTQSQGDAIQMEVQVQAFSYTTNDELNNMTFHRYKLINRAVESIDSTYFAMWVDPDLGCSEDDYIGCDTSRSMMYVYNQDAQDGSSGINCTGGVATYGNDIPYLGVDYFRGPLAPKVFGPNGILLNPVQGQPGDTIVELGMTSFIYYNRASPTTNPAQVDPGTAQQYYNYLTGSWLNGAQVTFGGSGLGGTEPTNYVFPNEPNENDGWSMCTASLVEEDRRTIQASGPFRLDPGQVNELIIGVPWVPNVSYPCPDMGRLQKADDIAQGLFNSCFDIVDGPDAPDVNWVELDQKLIAVLSNDEISSNNKFGSYAELDPLAPNLPKPEADYIFEGYIVYQLANINVSIDELTDPDKARIVFQSDRRNGGDVIYNWEEVDNPNATILEEPTILVPVLKVEGSNEGVTSTFELTEDIFSGTALRNHTTYYYTAIAYAYNEYEPYNAANLTGQKEPFLEGRRNIRTYSVTPRPITDRTLLADYGDGAVITRLDGQGVGSNFLMLSNEERNRIFDEQNSQIPANYNGPITYLPGGGPVTIQVIDPLRVRDGDYVIRLDQSEELESGESGWELFDNASGASLGRASQSLENKNEQLFPNLGLSITINQTADVGEEEAINNGAIGQTITYADPRQAWLVPVPENANTFEGANFLDLNFMPTAGGELLSDRDPDEDFSDFGSGHFAPYTLLDYRIRPNLYATPAWLSPNSAITIGKSPIQTINNVDVVFTSDKSKWSRCVVVETGNRYFTDAGFETLDGKDNFEPVDRPSVSKDDNDGDGRPDPDGSGNGFAWFPGYAIDVETGTRVNIFFGENSVFGDQTLQPDILTAINGSDMMFNPSAQGVAPVLPPNQPSAYNQTLGGMHYIYVTKDPYDECAFINSKLRDENDIRRTDALSLVTWAGLGLRSLNTDLLSYADGLVPTETVVELRVDNPYATALGTNDNNSYPSYQFKIENKAPIAATTDEQINAQLDMINVVPNPYLAYSRYSTRPNDNIVKITNLPANCIVTIYSLDGQFIRQYDRNEAEVPNSGSNPGVSADQISPAISWDLKNSAGIPIASGVYLIHVAADGLGERVIKWFGVNRQFDPSGL